MHRSVGAAGDRSDDFACTLRLAGAQPRMHAGVAVCSGPVTYVPQAADTRESVDRAVFDGLRRMTPLRRLQIAAGASRALHRLSVAGLKLRFPDASDDELARRAGAIRLGAKLTRQAFGRDAEAWIE